MQDASARKLAVTPDSRNILDTMKRPGTISFSGHPVPAMHAQTTTAADRSLHTRRDAEAARTDTSSAAAGQQPEHDGPAPQHVAAEVLAAVPQPTHSGETMQQPAFHAFPLATQPTTTDHAHAGASAQTEVRVAQHAPAVAAPVIDDLRDARLRVGATSSELKVSVQLPEIGRVEVRAVSIGHGQEEHVTAHVTAQRIEGVQVLASERNGLEQSLSAQDVLLGSLGSHSQSQSHAQQQEPQRTAVQCFGEEANAKASIEPAPLPLLVPDNASISVLA